MTDTPQNSLSVRQLAAIMFTDIVGYTAMMGKDEDKAFALLKKNRDLQKPLIEKYNGKWLKELGDGVLAQFNSAYDAVKCAIDIQQAAKEGFEAQLRIGIHLGDVTNENGDVFGDGVNVASRVQGVADPGGIYITESVENAIRNRSDIQVKYLGESHLKNVDYPVKVYAVQGEGFPRPAFKERSAQTRSRKPLALLAILTALIIVLWLVVGKNNGSPAGPSQVRSLAVLPFVNLTGSENQEYLAEGLQDALISEVSHISSLRVISRTSAMQYAHSAKSLPQIANELNVDALIETSMLSAGDSIRLNVQLIRASPKEAHIWAGFFDCDMKHVFTMVSDVTQNVAKNIKVALLPEEAQRLATKKTVDPEIYKLYLQGKFELNKKTHDGFQKGRDILNKVIEMDPTYALAYATLSIGYGDLGHLPTAPQDAFPRAKELATQALALDSTLVDALTAMAECENDYDWNLRAAKNYYEAALAIDSNFVPALANYGWLLGAFGYWAPGERYLRKAAELDPLIPLYRGWLAWYLWDGHEYDKAIIEAKRVLELSPDNPLATWVLGGAYADIGKFDEAIALNEKATKAAPGLMWGLCAAYFKAGRKKEAMAVLDSMEKSPRNAYSLLRAYEAMGEIDSALKWLQVVNDTRHPFRGWLARVHSTEPVAKDPRFARIMKPIIDSYSALQPAIDSEYNAKAH